MDPGVFYETNILMRLSVLKPLFDPAHSSQNEFIYVSIVCLFCWKFGCYGWVFFVHCCWFVCFNYGVKKKITIDFCWGKNDENFMLKRDAATVKKANITWLDLKSLMSARHLYNIVRVSAFVSQSSQWLTVNKQSSKQKTSANIGDWKISLFQWRKNEEDRTPKKGQQSFR